MAWDVMSGVTKTAWDVLSGMANLCGMFCPGCKKNGMGCFVPECFVRLPTILSQTQTVCYFYYSFLSNLFILCSSACKRYGFVTINL